MRALSEPAEQRMLGEVFLASTPVLRSDAVVGHFQSALRAALAGVCQTKPAAEWVNKAGAAHYRQHLPRLHEWAAELRLHHRP